jgi:hypothetical protein
LADEEAVTDVLCNGLYQERRDAVRDPDPHAVANFSDRRFSGACQFSIATHTDKLCGFSCLELGQPVMVRTDSGV